MSQTLQNKAISDGLGAFHQAGAGFKGYSILRAEKTAFDLPTRLFSFQRSRGLAVQFRKYRF